MFSGLHQHSLKLKPPNVNSSKAGLSTWVMLLVLMVWNQALSDWPEPHNIKTLRSFLGFTCYYRRFIKDYVRIIKPLNDLLFGHPTNQHAVAEMQKKKKKKVTPWQWGEAEQTLLIR